MILVGSGALLSRAAEHARRLELAVDFVCCPSSDVSIFTLKRLGVPYLESSNPNTDLRPILGECTDNVAFSINNRHILGDDLLDAGVSFFNIHGGLVQQYRGRAEMCIFAALCRGEKRYGVTLHRILPKHRVDSGPVIAQNLFEISEHDRFSDVLTRTLAACQRTFEENVSKIINNSFAAQNVLVSQEALSYKDLPRICAEARRDRLARACDFGVYADLFPTLKSIVGSLS